MSDEKRKAQEHETPEFPEQRDDSPYASMNEPRGCAGRRAAARAERDEAGRGGAAGRSDAELGRRAAEQRRGAGPRTGARRGLSDVLAPLPPGCAPV